MAPTYPIRSLLVVGQIDAGDVQQAWPSSSKIRASPVGSYASSGGRAPSTPLQFVTRGDANAMADPAPVPARFVRGRVLWAVSHVGSVMDWLQWPRSFIALVVVPGGLLALSEWRARRSARRAQGAAV